MKAKKYAREKGESLSDLVENHLKFIIEEREHEKINMTPTVKLLRGSFKTLDKLDYKKELSKKLKEKYE